jgi:hypothetical protein
MSCQCTSGEELYKCPMLWLPSYRELRLSNDMRHFLLIIGFLIILVDLNGQQTVETIEGQVSFISSKNVYVKFKSTEGISAGDTLFAKSGGKLIPVLIVDNLSSISCVCNAIAPAKPAVADFVSARRKPKGADAVQVVIAAPVAKAVPATDTNVASPVAGQKTVEVKQHISGSVSVSSYTDMSDAPAANSQRFRYTLSLNARNIGSSKFSFESYASFRHKIGDWDVVKSDIFNALKIFNLALVYEPSKSTRISIGRRINPRLSNIGAADGLQIEKSFGMFSIGALGGTRPDYTDYGFNSKLLQFGGYMGLSTKNSTTFSESSLAFMQQMNGSSIDRRFLYFQHSNSVIRNLYFIGTFEVDLYRLNVDTIKHTETATNVFDPTGLYLSLRYRFSDKLSISGSYDARKNVIYYETYKTFTDRMLETDLRQGFRLQGSYRFTRDLTFGLQTGYRFLKSDPHPSRNAYGYLTYNNFPGLNVTITLSGAYTESGYINSVIYGANVSRDFFKSKLQGSIGYHYVDYTMAENLKEIQHIGEINLFCMLPAKMSFGINYEGTFEQKYKYNRFYLQLRKRF